MAALKDSLARVMPNPTIIEVSARTGQGVDEWLRWLGARRPKPGVKPAAPHHHHHHHEHDHGHAHGPHR